MPKGTPVTEILETMPPDQRHAFIRRLKTEHNVDVTFTLSKSGRKRKHRWSTAKGHVVAIRLTDQEHETLLRRSEARTMSPAQYLKWLLTRTHKKQ